MERSGCSDGSSAERIRAAAALIVRSRRMVVSTGAGISHESGIPTFRGTEGLWGKYRPEELATREGFLANPALVWRWYRERLAQARTKRPHAGHLALGELERLVPRFLLVTQNVDGLHRAAGSREIVELHGSISRYRCLDYAHPVPEDSSWGGEPPLCRCGSLVRPDVVWFGEPLPQAELECAFRETQKCDLFLLIGTSGVVQPAALLPVVARQAGAALIEVNVAPSEITPTVDIFLEGRACEVLPELVRAARDLGLGRNSCRAKRKKRGPRA